MFLSLRSILIILYGLPFGLATGIFLHVIVVGVFGAPLSQTAIGIIAAIVLISSGIVVYYGSRHLQRKWKDKPLFEPKQEQTTRTCKVCGMELSFIQDRQEWFCERCNTFVR